MIATTQMVEYETQMQKKNLIKLSAAVQKKVDEGAKLTKGEQAKVDIIREINEDLAKDNPLERRGWTDGNFMEEYQYVEEDPEVSVEPEKTKSKKPKAEKKTPSRKRKQADTEEEPESKPKKPTKKSKKTTKKQPAVLKKLPF